MKKLDSGLGVHPESEAVASRVAASGLMAYLFGTTANLR